MLDRKAFSSIPISLDMAGQKMPVTMTGRKPTYWKCGETFHFSSSSSEKKASEALAPTKFLSGRVCEIRLACSGHASDWDPRLGLLWRLNFMKRFCLLLMRLWRRKCGNSCSLVGLGEALDSGTSVPGNPQRERHVYNHTLNLCPGQNINKRAIQAI